MMQGSPCPEVRTLNNENGHFMMTLNDSDGSLPRMLKNFTKKDNFTCTLLLEGLQKVIGLASQTHRDCQWHSKRLHHGWTLDINQQYMESASATTHQDERITTLQSLHTAKGTRGTKMYNTRDDKWSLCPISNRVGIVEPSKLEARPGVWNSGPDFPTSPNKFEGGRTTNTRSTAVEVELNW